MAANTQAIETIQVEHKLQSRLLQKLVNRHEQGDGGDLPDDISLPVQYIEELEELDITLRDKAVKKKVVSSSCAV